MRVTSAEAIVYQQETKPKTKQKNTTCVFFLVFYPINRLNILQKKKREKKKNKQAKKCSDCHRIRDF